MSLQRVFESARKLGLPVILTDPAGREPMVVLPLEQFEAMAGDGHPSVGPAPTGAVASPAHKILTSSHQPVYAPVSSSMYESPMPATPAVAPSQKIDEIKPTPVRGLSPEAQESFGAVALEKSESPLEERFYLESVEDQNDV